ANIETGALRKWTSRTRHQLFETMAYTPIPTVDIDSYVPKLGTPEQATCFVALVGRSEKLNGFWKRSFTCLPLEASKNQESPKVFLASTAYNFLNVFRSLMLNRQDRLSFSENRVHCF